MRRKNSPYDPPGELQEIRLREAARQRRRKLLTVIILPFIPATPLIWLAIQRHQPDLLVGAGMVWVMMLMISQIIDLVAPDLRRYRQERDWEDARNPKYNPPSE